MKILAVDNDKRLVGVIKEVFENYGFEVVTSNDGDDAKKKINIQKDIELIITDIKMPKKDGLELVKELRDEGNEIPIVFFTGNSNIGIKNKCLELGVNEYIVKPVDFMEVIEKVRKYEK